MSISAGGPILSDAIDFPVAPGTEISVSLYFPNRVSSVTWHSLALKRAVVSTTGDHTREEKIQGGTESESAFAVSAVFVPAHPSQRLIVALGDSIVDGDGSTVDADKNWPSYLVRRLQKTSVGSKSCRRERGHRRKVPAQQWATGNPRGQRIGSF